MIGCRLLKMWIQDANKLQGNAKEILRSLDDKKSGKRVRINELV